SPLFGVMGLAEAIGEEEDLETIHRHAAEIVTYARSIKDIVVQLSGYSRTAEREYLANTPLDAVITDAVRLVVRTVGLDEEAVSLDIAPGLAVVGRASELQQVMVNLVKNAVEAVGDAGRALAGAVRVEAVADEGEAVVRVQDRGPGIPGDALREIFDPFFTTKPPGRGTGLGLNIVYRLVTKYRGTIHVDSVVGEGTVFTVRLPLADAAGAA
ncbi:MAG: HAMP domain-containing histidine kinase, partial [Myxococcales bacterium]|nr:HAMP domain-containing histidine kinase [Myxococcales bacterium]